MSKKEKAESVVREIRRKTRKKYSGEERIRIVLEGLRGDESIAALCRREGINPNLYYKWSKEFLDAGKRRLTGEYYHDQFKNIDHQFSLATAIGYHFIYSPKTKWEISGGIGGRYTRFVSVEPGQSIDSTSPGIGAGTIYDTELTNWMDFLVDYSFQIVNEEAGNYTHHFVTTLSKDFIKNFDFDFIWDRIRDPQPDSEGNIPKKDDYQLIFGLNYDI